MQNFARNFTNWPIKDEIWVLVDNRPGNYSQAIGLATELKIPYRIVNISYNLFSFLPNKILRENLFGLTSETQKKIQEFGYFPKLIIAAGRRSAPVSLYLKKQSQNRTKIAQIMKPEIFEDKFDFIILPTHDEYHRDEKNVIRTLGSLTKTNELTIAAEKEKFAQWFADITKPKIALIIGGSSKKTEFTKNSVIKLTQIASKIAKEMHAKLLVINSRRTRDELTDAIKSALHGDFKLYDWKKIKSDENPFLAILGYSDFFIVSGDSVSMISESCSTGKPVYIFDEKNISTKKHRKFHHDLFSQNYAKKIDEKTCLLENFSSKKLNETKRVAQIISASLN